VASLKLAALHAFCEWRRHGSSADDRTARIILDKTDAVVARHAGALVRHAATAGGVFHFAVASGHGATGLSLYGIDPTVSHRLIARFAGDEMDGIAHRHSQCAKSTRWVMAKRGSLRATRASAGARGLCGWI